MQNKRIVTKKRESWLQSRFVKFSDTGILHTALFESFENMSKKTQSMAEQCQTITSMYCGNQKHRIRDQGLF